MTSTQHHSDITDENGYVRLDIKPQAIHQLVCDHDEVIQVGHRPISYPNACITVKANDFTTENHSQHDTTQPRKGDKVLKLRYLMPPIIVNCRKDAKTGDPNNRGLLSAQELAYFKTNGNNALIFIHGFNVAHGHFPKQIQNIQLMDTPQTLPAIAPDLKHAMICYSEADRTLYRDIQLLEKRFPQITATVDIIKPDGFQFNYKNDEVMNGTSAHNWFIHMEDNFNRATKQFHRNNYLKFTRMIHIGWSGDVDTANYMAAVTEATHVGKRLVKLIEQLISEKIVINIVAHSLGNQVLLSLMESLALETSKKSSLSECLNHIFMWDAAVPDNVFSSPAINQNISGAYRFPHAHQSAKRITVLYSKHDNILGPMPQDKKLQEKWNDPSGGAITVALCKIIAWLDECAIPNKIKSVYNVANMLGKPLDYFFENKENRVNYYEAVINKHPYSAVDLKPFLPTLKEQTKFDANRYPQTYDGLSLVFAAYKQGILIGLMEFTDSYLQFMYTARRHFPELFSVVANRSYVVDPIANQMASIMITLFTAEGAEPRPALGYSGPDLKDKTTQSLYNSGKLIDVDQTPWLFTHSGMRIPSDALMENVYQRWIINKKNGINQFGRYELE